MTVDAKASATSARRGHLPQFNPSVLGIDDLFALRLLHRYNPLALLGFVQRLI